MKLVGVFIAPCKAVKFGGMNLAPQSLLLHVSASQLAITRTVGASRTIQ
jgi:hypothetical protein